MGAPRCDDVLLSRIVLLLSPSLAQLLGSPTVYEDQMLSALTERGLITAISRERENADLTREKNAPTSQQPRDEDLPPEAARRGARASLVGGAKILNP